MADTPHNHMTRDIKAPGECPRCDLGYLRAEPAVQIPTTRVATGYGDRLMTRIKAEANTHIRQTLEDVGRLEWAIFRRATPAEYGPFDSFTHATRAESISRIDRMYPSMKDQLEPRARLTTEWFKA